MVDRSALARATESTTSPTPGYLYNDLAKSAATSPSAASEIATYLIRRLQSKNNVNIKYKCLKVIQMVSVHPATRGQFKRVIVQDTNAISAIKSCLQFRGPPDAIHGDMLYEKVRNQAKETLDSVYSDDPSSEQGHGGMGGMGGMGSMSGGQSGFGSQSYGGGNGYSSSGYGNTSMSSSGGGMGGPKKMEGIGNPMFADPRLDQKKDIGEMTMSDVISGVKEGFVGMIKDPLARNVPSVGGGSRSIGSSMPGIGSSSYGGSSRGGWNTAPPGQSQLSQSTNGAWTMASNRGPNAISSDSYKAGAGNISSGVGGSWGSSTPSVASQSHHMAHNPNPVVNIPSGSTGGAKSDGTYERNLITELCPPGGMKAEPPPDKMSSFAQAIPNLNSDLICPALLDALEDGQPWIIRAKALCVMEVCINVAEESFRSGRAGNNAYADFFHACKDEIEPLATHNRSAVRDPAKRVLKALGLDVPEKAVAVSTSNVGVAKKAAASVPAPAGPAPNLLDFDEPVAPASVPPPPPTEAPPPPPAPTAGNSQNLFGGMQMKSETTNAQVAPAPAPPAPAPPAPLLEEPDLLGNISQPVVQAPVPSTSAGSLFDDVAIKSTPPVNTSAPVVEKENVENAATSASSSGFSFITAGSEEDKPQSNPPPSKDTFDPLLGLDTTGVEVSLSAQSTSTGLNPQMAAVVQQQQQQILMMQAQMQQMQMANGARFMMMQQQQQQQQGQMSNRSMSSATMGTNPMVGGQIKQNVMGAHNGSGVATSFAFMEDPNKVRKDATNKKFDFVQDAMKGAR